MQRKINLHFCLIILAAAMWGFAGIFVRTAQKFNIGEMELVFGRAIWASIIMFIIILFKNYKLLKIKLKDLWLFFSAGFFSIVLFNYSYYKTMSETSLSVAAVLLYTAPFFVVILSAIIFKERMTPYKVFACIIAFCGCCLVSQVFNTNNRISSTALFFGLLTGFGYGLYTIFGELLIKRKYQSTTITFYVFLSAVICCIPFTNITGLFTKIYQEPKALYIVILMAIFNTVIPYICYTKGLLGVEPSVAPIIATIEPVVATFVGAVLFKESLNISSVSGIILVLGSVVILNLKPLTIKANAKINLSLNILGKREDGYHLIDTVMQSVSLCDKITLKKSKEIRVICKNSDLSNEKNICYKAALLFFEKTNINYGVKIKINKNIPLAAGLGGGSADAAAVLIGLNLLYNTNLNKNDLCLMAEKIGVDVPFFIYGGTCRAEGIGEKITKLDNLKKGWFLLVKIEEKLSTKDMFSKIDSKDYSLTDTVSVIDALKNNDLQQFCKITSNSFEATWENNSTKQILKNCNSLGVVLSGSGPTWYGVFEKREDAIKAYKKLKSKKIESYLVRPTEKSIYIE